MRVILAEDSVLLREGLASLLGDEGYDVVAAVGDAGALIDAVAAHRPDVVVTDVRMPPDGTDDGLRAALRIRDRWPDTAVLVLSQYAESRLAAELITGSTGGTGYVLKDRVAQVGEFLDALERVASGGTAVDPEVVRRLLSRSATPLQSLTDRETDVLTLIAEGLTNPAIGERLHVSLSSVEKHANAIFDQLGLARTSGVSRRVVAVVRYLGA